MSNKTILFADDSATMRTIMENTFSAEPYDVATVPSGEAAIMKAREICPDIVIADAGMAGVSGYDVCKAVREDSSLSNTSVIVMAGVSSPYNEARGGEVGVDEYLKKPFDTTHLIEKIEELTSRAVVREVIPAEPESPPTMDRPAADPPSAAVSRPLTEKPAVAPMGPRPIASPMAAQATTKKTMEYVQSAQIPDLAAEEFPVQTQAESFNEPEELADPEPIELRQEIKEPESIQVSTLAELAQVDNQGEPIKSEALDDAIELSEEAALQPEPVVPTTPPQPEQPAKPRISSLPIQEAVRERARMAAEEIEDEVDDLTDQQLESIRALTVDAIERVVWEIVPDLAETIIKEEIARLLEE
ncbi:MAG: response regulator [Proteobacteria bacterium]|nr:response regulator [Pseudomonadota bacterium]